MASLTEITMTRWFTDDYRERNKDEMEMIRTMIAATDPAGHLGSCGALRDPDLRGEIASISLPRRVIAGKHDPATPPSDGLAIHRAVPDSKYVELEASHLSAWERAEEFGVAVCSFLGSGKVCNG